MLVVKCISYTVGVTVLRFVSLNEESSGAQDEQVISQNICQKLDPLTAQSVYKQTDPTPLQSWQFEIDQLPVTYP